MNKHLFLISHYSRLLNQTKLVNYNKRCKLQSSFLACRYTQERTAEADKAEFSV